MLLTFRTVLTWWASNTLPLREVTMTRPYLPGVCKSEYSVCLDRFTGNKLSTKFPSIFARLCLGANRYSTFSSMRYLLKLAPSRIEISTGAEAKNTGWLATKWPSLWNDVLSPSCNTCRNILECSNSARAMNQHQHQRSGASVFNPRSWITEMMKRCVEYHQVLLGQRHLVSTALLFTSKIECRMKMLSKLYNVEACGNIRVRISLISDFQSWRLFFQYSILSVHFGAQSAEVRLTQPKWSLAPPV